MMSIGERLKAARMRAGLSQRALAAGVGVSAQAISKYERGLSIPSSGVLIRLAKILEVRVEYFFRPQKVSLGDLSYRRKSSLSAKQIRRIQGQIQEWLERYIEIEEILEAVHTFEPVSFKIISPEDVEDAAQELRQKWNLGFDPIGNLTEVLEEKGIKIGLVDCDDSFDACVVWADDKFPVIAVRHDLPGDRQRFNLAHELGHIVLKVEGELDAEKLTRRFAGAFLVPKVAARDELGDRRMNLSIYELHTLKHKYGLSMQGWIYRANELGIISDSAAQKLFRMFRSRGWHVEEPGDQIPSERPMRLKRLVIRALSEGLISRSRAAELLGKPLEQFWKEEADQYGEMVANIGG
jgi:Zn-dependent peptidase ImmA (M78 family)/DNA-binding XRE family transcriptional regulator